MLSRIGKTVILLGTGSGYAQGVPFVQFNTFRLIEEYTGERRCYPSNAGHGDLFFPGSKGGETRDSTIEVWKQRKQGTQLTITPHHS